MGILSPRKGKVPIEDADKEVPSKEVVEMKYAVHDVGEFGSAPVLIPFEELQFFEGEEEEIQTYLTGEPPHYNVEVGPVEHVVFLMLDD